MCHIYIPEDVYTAACGCLYLYARDGMCTRACDKSLFVDNELSERQSLAEKRNFVFFRSRLCYIFLSSTRYRRLSPSLLPLAAFTSVCTAHIVEFLALPSPPLDYFFDESHFPKLNFSQFFWLLLGMDFRFVHKQLRCSRFRVLLSPLSTSVDGRKVSVPALKRREREVTNAASYVCP